MKYYKSQIFKIMVTTSQDKYAFLLWGIAIGLSAHLIYTEIKKRKEVK